MPKDINISALDSIFENQINIDTIKIESDSAEISTELFNQAVNNNNWKELDPEMVSSLDSELRSLKTLINMKKIDERVQMVILNAISNDNSNPTMYKSLSDIQKNLITLTSQINETIKNIRNIIKTHAYNKNDNEQINEDLIDSNNYRCRGSKDFISKMIN